MKKILYISIIVLSFNVNAQITLEHIYDSAATIVSSANPGLNQLIFVKFEVSGERWVKINRVGKNICIYNINHELLKTIPALFLPSNAASGDILYLSEHLFNNDPKIEFMFLEYSPGTYYTAIYNEDGTKIFSDTGAAMIKLNVPQQQYPIYNTSQGTKMILSYTTGEAKVFSLTGTLSNDIAQANQGLLANSSFVSNAYPNPAQSTTRVDYTLPDGVNEGVIVFYNLHC